MTTDMERARPAAIDQKLTDAKVRSAVVDELEGQVQLIEEAMRRTLKKDVHYGTIPGTQKPSLWQPGAEMLSQMFRFQSALDRTETYEDWDKGIFSYTYKCRLMNRSGELITEREGTCATEEDKYKSQHVARTNRYGKELRAISPAEQREVVMQMAQKRAYVSAVRGAAAASAIFSQDDDIVPNQGGNSQDEGHGICAEHKVPYYQKGKMFSPAHPTDGGGWCNKKAGDTGGSHEAVRDMDEQVANHSAPSDQPDAMRALTELYEQSGEDKLNFISTYLGRDVTSWNAVTEVEWGKVKAAAIDQLDGEARDERLESSGMENR